jgi:ADP-ribose pyrophosphatase YjhB (NUDIX family)
VKSFEPLKETIKREIKEETGMNIEPKELIGVYEIIQPSEHRIVVYWWADWVSGELKPSSDLMDAKFLSKEEVKKLVEEGKCTEIVMKVLKDIGWI